MHNSDNMDLYVVLVISVTMYSDRYDSFVPNVTDIFGSSEHSPAGAGRPPGVWTDVGPA